MTHVRCRRKVDLRLELGSIMPLFHSHGLEVFNEEFEVVLNVVLTRCLSTPFIAMSNIPVDRVNIGSLG
jgi:hypothetical protein